MILLHGRATRAAFAAEKAADRERALPHSIDSLIGAHERSLNQDAALNGLRVADRRHGHVDARAGLGKGRNVRRDHDRRDIVGLDRVRRHIHAEALERIRHTLHGIGKLAVTLARETDHQAVPDQLVIASAFDHSQVLNPSRKGIGR